MNGRIAKRLRHQVNGDKIKYMSLKRQYKDLPETDPEQQSSLPHNAYKTESKVYIGRKKAKLLPSRKGDGLANHQRLLA